MNAPWQVFPVDSEDAHLPAHGGRLLARSLSAPQSHQSGRGENVCPSSIAFKHCGYDIVLGLRMCSMHPGLCAQTWRRHSHGITQEVLELSPAEPCDVEACRLHDKQNTLDDES
jgi:hypothetical protein